MAHTSASRQRAGGRLAAKSSRSCEASYLLGETSRSVTTNPGKPEQVTLVATTNPCDVVIGVAGAHAAQKYAFELEVTLSP